MKALVTGGGGFLGEALVRALRARGDEVRILARSDYPALRALGIETVRGDIRDAAAVAAACVDMDVVFHTAAKAGGWGDPRDYEASNIGGTDNVIAGCRAAGVRHLVYTSTPSVVHAGGDIEGGDESLPYATRFTAHYPRTKAEAERRVRAASDKTSSDKAASDKAASDKALATVSIRPHFIWGPGDRHLLPRLLERARTGRLRRVGSGDPLTDTTYVDNCVNAHLLAADRLRAGAAIGGRVYFVSDGSPIGVWTMADRMLAAAGAPPIHGSVPASLAFGVGALLEGWHALTRNQREPLMTRFGAAQLAHAQWFRIDAARDDLGYEPLIDREEGLRRLAASYGDNIAAGGLAAPA